ncbi:MAG: hypothetical protein ACRC6X_07830 [Culicoidibacterales bacterium]
MQRQRIVAPTSTRIINITTLSTWKKKLAIKSREQTTDISNEKKPANYC